MCSWSWPNAFVLNQNRCHDIYNSKWHVKLQHICGLQGRTMPTFHSGDLDVKMTNQWKNLRTQTKERRSGWGRKQPSFVMILSWWFVASSGGSRIFSSWDSPRHHLPTPVSVTADVQQRVSVLDGPSVMSLCHLELNKHTLLIKASMLVQLLPVKPSLHNEAATSQMNQDVSVKISSSVGLRAAVRLLDRRQSRMFYDSQNTQHDLLGDKIQIWCSNEAIKRK